MVPEAFALPTDPFHQLCVSEVVDLKDGPLIWVLTLFFLV